MGKKKIILFDGKCVLCSKSLKFILKRDKHSAYIFIPFQSKIGQFIRTKYKIIETLPDSLILIDRKKIFNKSAAALKIAKNLNKLWPLLFIFILLPRKIRDLIYLYISNNRYNWFGEINTCTTSRHPA